MKKVMKVVVFLLTGIIIINIFINIYDKISGNKGIRKSISERWGGLQANKRREHSLLLFIC